MSATAEQLPEKFEDQLLAYAPQIKAVLPSHIPPERFERVIITAINQNPALANADRRSLFTACVKAAQDGLLPDGRESALVVYNTKIKGTNQWVAKVQYLPMIGGIRKLMRQSGAVTSAEAHVVYENDEFIYQLGDDPKIVHKPCLAKASMSERGQPVGAYAVIKLANGETLREVMSVEEINQARAVSRAKDDGPWVTWWGEMARKTVMRRCSKSAPMSADLDAVLKRDDELEPGDTPPARPTRVEFAPAPAIEAVPPSKPKEMARNDTSDDLVLQAIEAANEGSAFLRGWLDGLQPKDRSALASHLGHLDAVSSAADARLFQREPGQDG